MRAHRMPRGISLPRSIADNTLTSRPCPSPRDLQPSFRPISTKARTSDVFATKELIIVISRSMVLGVPDSHDDFGGSTRACESF